MNAPHDRCNQETRWRERQPYSDRLSVFHVYARETAHGGPGRSQFGRALRELNIDSICANSPEAEGRVERANSTLQDRLVKELRLRGISTPAEAEPFLAEFIADYNRRFAKPARVAHDAHRPLLPGEAARQRERDAARLANPQVTLRAKQRIRTAAAPT